MNEDDRDDELGPVGVISILCGALVSFVIAGAAFGWLYFFKEVVFK